MLSNDSFFFNLFGLNVLSLIVIIAISFQCLCDQFDDYTVIITLFGSLFFRDGEKRGFSY